MLDLLTPDQPAPAIEESKRCEQCQQPFTPRTHTGGKPQRFCSMDCRTAFHAAQRDQHKPTCSDVPPVTAFRQPSKRTPTTRDRKDDWEWWDEADNEDCIVQTRCDGVAIYENTSGRIVIRAEGRDGEYDPIVQINRENLLAVIDKLCDLAGIGSGGKQS